MYKETTWSVVFPFAFPLMEKEMNERNETTTSLTSQRYKPSRFLFIPSVAKLHPLFPALVIG
jgi:hypothetical protein